MIHLVALILTLRGAAKSIVSDYPRKGLKGENEQKKRPRVKQRYLVVYVRGISPKGVEKEERTNKRPRNKAGVPCPLPIRLETTALGDAITTLSSVPNAPPWTSFPKWMGTRQGPPSSVCPIPYTSGLSQTYRKLSFLELDPHADGIRVGITSKDHSWPRVCQWRREWCSRNSPPAHQPLMQSYF